MVIYFCFENVYIEKKFSVLLRIFIISNDMNKTFAKMKTLKDIFSEIYILKYIWMTHVLNECKIFQFQLNY